jgi:hypothetical protein
VATRQSAPRAVCGVSRYGLVVPAQRTVAADLRSAFPHRAGVPWWGAVVIAASATLAGLAIEAGFGRADLGIVFAMCYAAGCIGAALAVRQSSIFTAVVQPPLLLFVAVPLAYFLFHGSEFGGLKDILITCGYPLIERFPLMLFTSVAVLLVGMTRWFLAMSPASAVSAASAGDADNPRPARFAGLSATLSSAFARSGTVARDNGVRRDRPRHGVDRSSNAGRPRPPRRPPEPAPERPRQDRRRPVAARADIDGPVPRRREPTGRSARGADAGMEPPRRRPRPVRDPGRIPESQRRDPRYRRDDRDYPPRPTRNGRLDPYEAPRGYPVRDPYPPYPPSETARRRGRGTPEGTHHPISRVRYRDASPTDAGDRDSYRNRSGR